MKKILLLSLFVFALAWCNQTKTSPTEWKKSWTEKQVNQNTTGSKIPDTSKQNTQTSWVEQKEVDKDTQEVLDVMDGLLK